MNTITLYQDDSRISVTHDKDYLIEIVKTCGMRASMKLDSHSMRSLVSFYEYAEFTKTDSVELPEGQDESGTEECGCELPA